MPNSGIDHRHYPPPPWHEFFLRAIADASTKTMRGDLLLVDVCVCVNLVNGFVWWLAGWWCLWLLAQVCGSDWTLGLCVFCIGQGHEGEQRIQRLHQSMILVVVMWLLVQLITSYHEDII